MEFSVSSRKDGAVLVTVAGSLVQTTVEDFNRKMQSLASGSGRVAIDLSGVTDISSAGIGALVSRTHELIRGGVKVSLVRPAPMVARLLHHTNLDKVLEMET